MITFDRDIELHQRLLKLLYDHNEEHVGSCFTCVDIIDEIFKNKDEQFEVLKNVSHKKMLDVVKSIEVFPNLSVIISKHQRV